MYKVFRDIVKLIEVKPYISLILPRVYFRIHMFQLYIHYDFHIIGFYKSNDKIDIVLDDYTTQYNKRYVPWYLCFLLNKFALMEFLF